MRYFLLMILLLLTLSVFAEPICWDTKVKDSDIATLRVPDNQVQTKSDGKYIQICIDFESAAKKLEYAGGGGCGGSSKCGSNFLVIGDITLELTNQTPFTNSEAPYAVLRDSGEAESMISVARNIDAAKEFIRNRKANELIILSDELEAATNHEIRSKLGISNDLNFLNKFKQKDLIEAKGIELRIENFQERGQMVHVKGKR